MLILDLLRQIVIRPLDYETELTIEIDGQLRRPILSKCRATLDGKFVLVVE